MLAFKRFLQERARATSQIEFASIDAARSDGGWDVKIVRTGNKVRASGPQTGYAPGQVVQISRTDASGVTKNTGYVILGLAAQTMRGSSSFVTVEETVATQGLTIVRVDPNPVVIAQGATVAVNIYGTGLAGVVVVYSSGYLTDAAGQVSTSTSITLSIHANVSTPPGDYALEIGGQSFPIHVHA
ncbi:MAG TPA: hypothetical protein VLC46_16395 [Thermoanaerobaculia bacterium]|jgi:hypothetical protein|nr:hypothetical protein [Thermoanaerobaculia bacterium]